VHVSPKATHWEITVAARDEKALLRRIAGALAHLGLSILSARIYTLGGGRVVDRFRVALPEEDTPEKLRAALTEGLNRGFRLGRGELRRRQRARPGYSVEGEGGIIPKVLTSNEISDEFTVVDVTCRDQIGLLFQVAAVFDELELSVHGAVLTTEADKAMDSFYITAADGKKILDDARREEIASSLERELASA
jgi:[protein-PII] uridylyltransferase